MVINDMVTDKLYDFLIRENSFDKRRREYSTRNYNYQKKRVKIYSREYDSIKEAARDLNVSGPTITNRIKANKEGYSYIND